MTAAISDPNSLKNLKRLFRSVHRNKVSGTGYSYGYSIPLTLFLRRPQKERILEDEA